MDAKVIVNGREFRVGYRFIKILAKKIGTSKQKNYTMAQAFASCAYPEVVIPLIEGDKLALDDYFRAI